ncbi:hypothetical protein DPMN_193204 [Dreissena polymorpha]|jgi:hypothetical protein|uniref:Uncharacterized protein n=1 Tax=Dreissena polymorpha TaxID=45954 RepID=A0A9D3Y6I1_DREPO|nr:hypothetical protein DPMN_193204 [Dreissena polymorpha]
MTPPRQHLLKNPQELVGFLAERKRVSAQRPPTQTSQPWNEYDAQPSQPWGDHDAGGTQEPFNADRESALKLRNELDSAVEALKSNEELEIIRVTMAADAQDLIESGSVPMCDHRSGGMDSDNADHLTRAIEDVAEQITKNDNRGKLGKYFLICFMMQISYLSCMLLIM